MVEYGVKSNILNLSKSSYAKEQYLEKDISLYMDCSNGINPFGFSKKVGEALANIPHDIVNTYAKSSQDLRLALADYWSDTSEIDASQIIIGDGSISLIYKVNKLFIGDWARVLGYSPQFSDYIDDIRTSGGLYDYYLMDDKKNFKFYMEDFIDRMEGGYKLFYLDNPNNPTGQVIDLASIEEIVKKARQLELPIIIDEAYGDFIAKKDSAISLVNKYDNLIVIRTFSKGLGLAGTRGGYIVSSKKFISYLEKISNPFEMNNIARYLALAAIRDRDFIGDSSARIRNAKKKLVDSFKKLRVLETDFSIPIMTIMHPDINVDLEDMLLSHHILSVSGRGFIGLGKNSARIIMTQDVDSMISAFKKVEKEI